MRTPTFLPVLALILAGCGGAALEPTAPASPSRSLAAQTASPSYTSTRSPIPSNAPQLPTPPTNFSIAAAFGKEGWNSQIVDVVHWEGQFVALGTSDRIQSESREHWLWLSTDGHTWMRESLSLPDDSARPAALVPLDGRLAILGTVLDSSATPGTHVPRAWESRDLFEWLSSDLGIPHAPAVAHAVAYGPKGYVAAVGSTLWFAADGADWQKADDRSAMAVAAGGEGFVAVGSAGPGVARMDASGDGTDWFSGDTLQVSTSVSVSAVGPGEWVAIAGDTEFGIWRSEDGLAWTPTVTIQDLSGISAGPGIQTGITGVSLVTVGEKLFVSPTWNHCCAQLSEGRGLWTSEDGLTWAQVELERADGVVQAGATDGEITVLGGLTGRGAEGVMWVAAP